MVLRQINLDFRTDRWAECLGNHQAMGFSEGDVTRLSACYDKELGSLGCAKSHILALSSYYTLETGEYAVILEDDFDFAEPKQVFLNKIDAVRSSGLKWDVLMLAGGNVIRYDCEVSFLSKVFEAHTTSGYIVRRGYVPTLLTSFLESAEQLDRYKAFNPIDIIKLRFSIDQHWKTLQRRDNWYMFSPRMGVQRPSFSDIEQKHVDYGTSFAL